jgi:UDP:flavonoid glycosyltransferase YjiC (YdhE family)
MAHIHLTWELGGGLGHAGRLKPLAQALLARGHRVSLSLRDLVHTDRVLADLAVPRLQAPVWLHRAMGLPAVQASLAEILLTCGYLDPRDIQGLVTGWRGLFGMLQPDLLVADYAPTAVLAARSLGLRSTTVGLGFYMPPPGRPLPSLRDWESIPPQRLAGAEARVLATANAVLAGHDAPPLGCAADLWLGDVPLLCTWPELDHYARGVLPEGARWFGPNFLPQAGEAPLWPAGRGRKVFAYLKTDHPDHAAVLQALVAEGCRTLCFLPEVAAGKPPPVSSPLIHYARAPVSLDAAFADCALCICHAGEATLVQALLAGVPVLLLPMQAEQFLMARRVAQTGAAISAALLRRPVDWRALLRRFFDEPGFAAAAAAFAQRYSGFTQAAQVQALVGVFEAQLR